MYIIVVILKGLNCDVMCVYVSSVVGWHSPWFRKNCSARNFLSGEIGRQNHISGLYYVAFTMPHILATHTGCVLRWSQRELAIGL